MFSHQSSKDKAHAAKCNHFCHPFDVHNYCPTCREAGKGDDPCVTLLSPCDICSAVTEEQLTKITRRKCYTKRADKKSENMDSELLGNNSIESFGGSQAELEVAAIASLPPRLVLNLFHLRRYLFPHQLVLSLPLQVQLYSLKCSLTSRNHLVLVLMDR